jgi:hypothetical protein
MSETLTQPPIEEALHNPHAGLIDHVNDPNVGLGDVLSEAGFESMPPEGRLSLVEHASVDDYMGAVDVIHRKVASEHSHDPHPIAVSFVGKDGQVSSYAAQPEERAGIMRHALEAAKQVAQKYRQEGGSIEDALQRCGNLAAFGVVLAHNYENGNGRTARTLGELVHNGFDSSNPESVSDLAMVSANRPDKGFRINSYVPTGEWADGRANQDPIAFLDAVAALDIPLDSAGYSAVARSKFTTPRM